MRAGGGTRDLGLRQGVVIENGDHGLAVSEGRVPGLGQVHRKVSDGSAVWSPTIVTVTLRAVMPGLNTRVPEAGR